MFKVCDYRKSKRTDSCVLCCHTGSACDSTQLITVLSDSYFWIWFLFYNCNVVWSSPKTQIDDSSSAVRSAVLAFKMNDRWDRSDFVTDTVAHSSWPSLNGRMISFWKSSAFPVHTGTPSRALPRYHPCLVYLIIHCSTWFHICIVFISRYAMIYQLNISMSWYSTWWLTSA